MKGSDLFDLLESHSRPRERGFTRITKVSLDVPLVNILKKYCTPPLGAEFMFPNLFGKYGMTISGIADFWLWDEEALKEAPEKDLWQMLAIASTYWVGFYQELMRRREGEGSVKE